MAFREKAEQRERASAQPSPRLFWHLLLDRVLADFAPSEFEITSEFQLKKKPLLIDFLLVRRRKTRRHRKARVLRGLWPLIRKIGVVEFKSKARPFRRGDLVALHSYATQYHRTHGKEVSRLADLAIVLLVPSLTPALHIELAELGWSLETTSRGYWRMHGWGYASYIAVLDDVAEAERDDLIRIFGRRKIRRRSTAQWLMDHSGLTMEQAMARATEADRRFWGKVMTLEGFRHELLKLIPAGERLSGIPAKRRLRGIPAKELMDALPAKVRITNLSADERVLALPVKALRAVASDTKYVATLAPATRRAIARRLKPAARR